ncbi:MAG TPA: hypothetical protein VGI63_08505 [Verrucomicrobiae bacterium]
MKKTLLLTVTLGLASVSSLTAANIEVFLTGSTAFRANCYTAATKLFVGGAPTIYYGDAAHGGSGSTFNSSTASWVMTGTPITQLTNIQGNTLIIHGLFTGSVQGTQTVEDSQKLAFPVAHGTAGANCDQYITNTPTIGFSDASTAVTPYPASGAACNEETVAVQPFVFAKSNGGGVMNSISNISYEQIAFGIPAGRIPLSTWTGLAADTNTFIYMAQRTKDSGTRRTETACAGYQYNDPVGVYIWNTINKNWYLATNSVVTSAGDGTNGVVGPAGIANANANWGSGYVGGGDVRTALSDNSTNNLSLGFISFGDTKSTALGGQNWGTVISFNGNWPTAAGVGLRGNTGTNDFSPIVRGYYPFWSEEIIVYKSDIDSAPNGDNKITTFKLGTQADPGSFIGVFNYQTKVYGGSPLTGSIENEIELSKTAIGGATAIRLNEMQANRNTVGGIIYPF